MLIQDIEAGHGIGFIDPHGDLAEELLDCIPPSRVRDVIYFNPGDREFPIGFNLLRTNHDQSDLVASGIVSAFKNVWRDSWGPRLEYILYASLAALADVEHTTLLGIPRMLSDARYREWIVRQVRDPAIRSFWENEFARYDKRLLVEAISPIQNKVGQLVLSPIIRNVVGQVKSRFEPRYIMDNRRIFIASLSKGALGEDKANLLGSLLVTAFQLAAMSRIDTPACDRVDWNLYVDEFQNFATESFASILSEARKFRLSLTLANQHTRQVPEALRDAVFGNVGTFISFRVSEADAAMLAREYGDGYSPHQFIGLSNFEAMAKSLEHGEQREPFAVTTEPPLDRRYGRGASIVRRARNSFAAPRVVVEDRIRRWMEGW